MSDRLTVLIVDDNPADRKEMRLCLLAAMDRQYTILEAETAGEALRICRGPRRRGPLIRRCAAPPPRRRGAKGTSSDARSAL